MVTSALVLQGYFRLERLRAPRCASPIGWSVAPRPDLMPRWNPGPVVQARRAPRARAATAWPVAPPPELLPGMGPARTGVPGGAVQRRPGGGVTTTPVPEGRLRIVGDGRALDPALRSRMEQFFDTDFSGVRIHEGPAAPALGALGFTLGETLYFAPGVYDPTTREGIELLGHELTHVVQQRDGRVANPHGDRVAIVQDPALEAEADRMGRRIAEVWARVGQPAMRSRQPPPMRTIQRSIRESKFKTLLTSSCGQFDAVLVIDNTFDDDHDSLAKTSVGFYKSLDVTVPKASLSWKYDDREITGTTPWNLNDKKVLVAFTSHGNVRWTFADIPDHELVYVKAFASQLGVVAKARNLTVVGVVLDACFSGTELHGSMGGNAPICSARLLSQHISVPVVGFDGKASSGTVSYYDAHFSPKTAHYESGLVFVDGVLANPPVGGGEVWHSAQHLQNQPFYQKIFWLRPGPNEYFRSR